MVENMLLSLPPDISCSILMKWIVLKDFVDVDSAHCRISCWRSLCQSPFLMLSHDLKRMKPKPAESSEVNLGILVDSRNRIYHQSKHAGEGHVLSGNFR